MIKVGFTGTQDGTTEPQFIALCKLMCALTCLDPDVIFHNGDCIGADEEAAMYALKLKWKLHLHPPKSNAKRAFLDKYSTWVEPPLDYLERNKNIVNQSYALIATPNGPEKIRSGTWSTIRYARKLGKRIYIIYPNGEFVVENYVAY
jgi:hypothetical protein